MARKNQPQIKRTFVPRKLIAIALFMIMILVSFGALWYPLAARQSTYNLDPGDVASQDIKAPISVSYQSTFLTEQARIQAERTIEDVFVIDSTIVNQQYGYLRQFLDSITLILTDETPENLPSVKRSSLLALPGGYITWELADALSGLSVSVWSQIKSETLNSFGLAMTVPIHESNLSAERESLSAGYSAGLENKWIVLALVSPFITVNSQYSESETLTARQTARDSVEPYYVQYKAGQMIVADGSPITPEIWEALQEFGLIKSEQRWQDLVSVTAITVLFTVFVILYFRQRNLDLSKNLRTLIVLFISYTVILVAAKMVIPNHIVIPYLFPIPAFGMIVATLFNFEIGAIGSLILSILAGINTPNQLELILFFTLASICGILTLQKGRRIAQFFFAGMIIGVIGSLVIVAFRSPDPMTDWEGITTLLAATFLCGLISASITLIFQLLFSHILGIPVPLRLLDLSRSDHPLLKRLLESAPGTYQHSLMVANLAEQAAEAIDADSLLTRVGAMYHDVGKLVNPSYYIENQIGAKTNPHDRLSPEKSAEIIIQHVSEGKKLARQHHLPPRLQDFISEHHGTMITRFQYSRALSENDNDAAKVDIRKFKYAGPTPQSRETAILMLADIVEARTRAELPASSEDLEELVKQTIVYCMKEDQLISTHLTLKNIQQITETFNRILKNIYHPRIQYPEITALENLEKRDMDYS